ncbi:MAG: hypothetical protein JXA25_11440 [Anaerolineales bacterium]|nr:hypothetical protein [Anaerolineales bacterium]
METNHKTSTNLPIRRPLTMVLVSSILCALLMAAASLAGLFFPEQVYSEEALLHAFFVNDVVNLVIGLPILIGSMWAAVRGKLLGLLLWPGALLFIVYTYIVYVFAMPLNWAFLLHLLLLTLSIYTLISLLLTIKPESVQQQLAGQVREKLCGGALIFLGLLMIAQVLGALVGEISSRTGISRADLALHTSDMILAPAWFVGGLLLWKRKPLGYVLSLGLLFQISMLFVGLLVLFLLEPFMLGVFFRTVDFIVIIIMGLPAFIPLGIFTRRIIKAGKSLKRNAAE